MKRSDPESQPRPNSPAYSKVVANDDPLLCKVVRRYGLSPREEDVLLMLLRGVHMKQAAALLGCSYSTVRTHVQRAARKLDCSGMSEMLARIVRDAVPAGGTSQA